MCTVMRVKLRLTGQLNWNDSLLAFPSICIYYFCSPPYDFLSSCTDAKWKLCQPLQLTPSLLLLPQDYPNCSPCLTPCISLSHSGDHYHCQEHLQKKKKRMKIELVRFKTEFFASFPDHDKFVAFSSVTGRKKLLQYILFSTEMWLFPLPSIEQGESWVQFLLLWQVWSL